jgi:hypothetical protein
MLLLGALFALFITGFWLYCLVDVALTPGNECRGLPKPAWVVIVAGTFVIGAVVWLAARRPTRMTSAAAPPGGDPGRPPAPFPPAGRDRSVPRSSRPGLHGWDGPDVAGNLEAEAALLRHPAGKSRPHGLSGQPGPRGPDDDPGFLRSLDRAIHGAEAGDDPAGLAGDEP